MNAGPADVSIRELRNHTKQVIEHIQGGGTVYLNNNGTRIATITPLRPATWADHIDEVLADGSPYDSGLADLLADDQRRADGFDADPGRPTSTR